MRRVGDPLRGDLMRRVGDPRRGDLMRHKGSMEEDLAQLVSCVEARPLGGGWRIPLS